METACTSMRRPAQHGASLSGTRQVGTAGGFDVRPVGFTWWSTSAYPIS